MRNEAVFANGQPVFLDDQIYNVIGRAQNTLGLWHYTVENEHAVLDHVPENVLEAVRLDVSKADKRHFFEVVQ